MLLRIRPAGILERHSRSRCRREHPGRIRASASLPQEAHSPTAVPVADRRRCPSFRRGRPHKAGFGVFRRRRLCRRRPRPIGNVQIHLAHSQQVQERVNALAPDPRVLPPAIDGLRIEGGSMNGRGRRPGGARSSCRSSSTSGIGASARGPLIGPIGGNETRRIAEANRPRPEGPHFVPERSQSEGDTDHEHDRLRAVHAAARAFS